MSASRRCPTRCFRAGGHRRHGRTHRDLRVGPAPLPRRADRRRHPTRPRGDRHGGRSRRARAQASAAATASSSRASSAAVSAALPGRPAQPLPGRQGSAFGTVPDLPGGQAEAMAVPFADVFALPIPERRVRRGGGAPDRHPADRLRRRAAGLDPAGRDRRRDRPRTRRRHGGAVRLALRPGAHPRRRHGARAAGPGRAARGRAGRRRAPCSGPDQVLEATGGRGADSVIEAVGADATVLDAVSCAATGGTVSIVGVNLNMALPFPMALVLLKSLTVRAVFAPYPAPGRRSCRSCGRDACSWPTPSPTGWASAGSPRPTTSSTPGATAS